MIRKRIAACERLIVNSRFHFPPFSAFEQASAVSHSDRVTGTARKAILRLMRLSTSLILTHRAYHITYCDTRQVATSTNSLDATARAEIVFIQRSQRQVKQFIWPTCLCTGCSKRASYKECVVHVHSCTLYKESVGTLTAYSQLITSLMHTHSLHTGLPAVWAAV
jgi:hypothetical protein